MNKSFKSIDSSFDSNTHSSFIHDNSFKRQTSLSYYRSDLLTWLQSQGISFPIELLSEKFADGALLCDLLQKSLKIDLKYYKAPTNSNECRFNIRKALSYLRSLQEFKSDYVWSEDDIFLGKASTILPFLTDIKKYLNDSRSISRCSASRRTASVLRKYQNEEDEQSLLLKEIIEKVKPWLASLGLQQKIKNSVDFIKDSVRNGVLLCSVVSATGKHIDFCENPQYIEEVYNNIQIAISAINSKIPIKNLQHYYYTEPFEVWSLLHTLMTFYPEIAAKKAKAGWPYNESLAAKLKESLISWVNRLGVISEDLQDFSQLVRSMRTGEVLALIVKKVVNKDVLGILKNPKTSKVCLMNIEKSLKVLQTDKNMSQQYTRDSQKIFEADSKFIMLLLEDLHRAHAGLSSRKRGKSYHNDGPFIVRSRSEKRTLTPQKSYSNISLVSFESKPESKNCDNHTNTSFSRKLIENSKSAMDFYKPSESFIQERKEDLCEFTWLRKLDVELPKGLNLAGEKIVEFSDGILLCKILSKLEMKDIEGVKNCNTATPQAKRNIKLAFDVLKKKPNLSSKALYIEDLVWQGDGHVIRLVLAEIHKIYKNTIYTLVRFNRKYRGSSFI